MQNDVPHRETGKSGPRRHVIMAMPGGWSGRMRPLTKFVDLRRDGTIAIVVVDNPPVNALRREVREGLTQTIAQARDEASIEAVVVTCAGRTFIAGADITEFDKPPAPAHRVDITGTIDSTRKPVGAAMVGTCAGRTFIAGADITEFDKPPAPAHSVDITGTIDSTRKPVVAA